MLLTVSRMVLAPILLVMMLWNVGVAYGVALVVFVAALVTDFLDGRVARARGETSDLGRLLDPLADAMVFFSLFGGFTAAGWMPWWLFAIVVFRELFMHIFLRPYLLTRGRVLAASRWGKLKTATQSVVGVAVLGAILAVTARPGRVAQAEGVLRTSAFWLLVLVALASVGSLVNYLAQLKTPAET